MLNKSMNRRGLSTTHIVLIVVAIFAVIMLVVCASQLRQLEIARSTFAQQFDDPEQRPEQVTIQMLIDEQYISAELVQSPFGPVTDGGGDFWLNPRLTVDEPANVTGDNRMIAAYDRAMYETQGQVNVAYYTGEVMLITSQEFDRLTALPANADVDFAKPTPQQPQ